MAFILKRLSTDDFHDQLKSILRKYRKVPELYFDFSKQMNFGYFGLTVGDLQLLITEKDYSELTSSDDGKRFYFYDSEFFFQYYFNNLRSQVGVFVIRDYRIQDYDTDYQDKVIIRTIYPNSLLKRSFKDDINKYRFEDALSILKGQLDEINRNKRLLL